MPNIRDASLKKPEENPVLGGGQSGVVSPYAPQSNAKSVNSGQFTNLADYVSANQGGIQRLGQAIKSDVQNKAATANRNFENTLQTSVQPNIQNFQSARKNFESFFNKPTISSEDISTATNVRTGKTPFSNQYYNALQDVNTASGEYSNVRNELKNLGSGQTLTNYLRGFGEEPSKKTLGETGLTRFLINQSQPGQEALNYATNIGNEMNFQPINEVQNLTNAYQQITPESLQGFSDTQRQNYISSLGALDRQRAGRNIASQLGIQDINQERKSYQDLSGKYNTLGLQLQSEQNILNNINNLSDQEIANILQQRINQNPYGVQKGNTYNIENEVLNPNQEYLTNNNTLQTTGSQLNRQNLQKRIQQGLTPLQQQQQEAQRQLSANKFLNYQNQLAGANTIQSTLLPNELARLQALSNLSGYDYTDFLNRSIT